MTRGVILDQRELLEAVLTEKGDDISREDGLVFRRVHSGRGKCKIEGAEAETPLQIINEAPPKLRFEKMRSFCLISRQ